METSVQACSRIAAALEDLSRQEAAALQAQDFAAVAAIQDRAAPLVEHLAAHEQEIASEGLLARIAGVLALRNQTAEWLAAKIGQVREELSQMEASRRRVSRLAPAYGAGASRVSRLSAVG